MMYYTATALKGDSVQSSIYAHLLAPHQKSLIVAKSCKLQIYQPFPFQEPLPGEADHPDLVSSSATNQSQLITEIHLNGRISLLTVHRPEHSHLDHLKWRVIECGWGPSDCQKVDKEGSRN
jgi:hypothetical protein